MEGSEKSGLPCPARCSSWRGERGQAVFSVPHAVLTGPCAVRRFLDKMRAESDDKIVLISNYTETLDVIERLLNAKKCVSTCLPFLRCHPC